MNWPSSAAIADGRMQLSWRYSRERYRKATIETLAGHYVQHLKALIAHCLLPDSGSYTPSDFPLVALAQSDLDAMALKPRQIEDIYPLAPLQSRPDVPQLVSSPNPAFTASKSVAACSGELNVPAFKQVWQQLVEHHPILRTRFQFENQDQPLQIVHKNAQLPITEYDWRADSAQQQAQRWQQLQADDQAKRFRFYPSAVDAFELGAMLGSGVLLFMELSPCITGRLERAVTGKRAYLPLIEALRRGDAALLPAVRPYRDYIAWLQSQDMAAAEAYWRTALSGFTAPTPLIIDKSSDNIGSTSSKRLCQTQPDFIGGAQPRHYRISSKQRQLTLNTLVQAAWGLLLSRYSGEQRCRLRHYGVRADRPI